MIRRLLGEGIYHTGDGHELYWSHHGTPGTFPWIFLHGGPGGKSVADHLTFFDLNRTQVVLFDQRGCGYSSPQGSVVNNTTELLLSDIEALREQFAFGSIGLLGISWGSWLALRYRHLFPHRVAKLVTACLFVPAPSVLESFLDVTLSSMGRDRASVDIVELYDALCSDDAVRQHGAARVWLRANLELAGRSMGGDVLEAFIDKEAIASIRIELHYLLHGFGDMTLGASVEPAPIVIQGRHDVLGMKSLEWLQRVEHPQIQIYGVGHEPFHPTMHEAIRLSLGG
ncbi:MAG TPA: alpha/beta fold hydrolase [Dyella sp.]|uniref:alpha/beta fold hydrolase n=1 Tax=Dyella sp. TaxID=1869338 RepID=UPI002F939FD1